MGKRGLVTSIVAKLVDGSPGGGVLALTPWPCRTNPQTTSFRVEDGDEEPCCTTARRAGPATTGRLQLRGAAGGEMYKTVNSVYFDSAADEFSWLDGGGHGEGTEEKLGGDEEEVVVDDESCFSTTTASEEWSEAVIRSLGRSTSTHRFFFDPGPPSVLPSSTLAASPLPKPTTPLAPPDDADLEVDDATDHQQEQPCASKSLAEGSVAVAVDSADPFGDFRASMEEMVSAHALRDWAALEELLSWYLRVNAKRNHPLIVGAFVDLLIGLAASSSTPATTTTTTTTTSNSGKNSKSASTSTTSVTATTATATPKQCGASCSSSSSCAAPDESGDAAEEKASDPSSGDEDDRIRRHRGQDLGSP